MGRVPHTAASPMAMGRLLLSRRYRDSQLIPAPPGSCPGMKLPPVALVSLLAAFLLPACGGEPSAADSRSNTTRDRGSASMEIGGEAWAAESAKARVNGSRLSIDLARSDTEANVTTRGQVKLSIPGFEGPGQYTAGSTSMFVVVSIDRSALADAAESDEKVIGAMKGALGGTEMHILTNAEVEVTSVTDTEVVGTFEFTPRAESPGPALTNGEFRAILK